VTKASAALGFALVILAPRALLSDSNHTRSLRIVQWNVLYNGIGTDRVRNRARQVAALAALQPDVVTLNEVTADAIADYKVLLERATGVPWRQHVSRTDGMWGNGLLSRYPIVSTAAQKMRVGHGRSVAQATLDVHGARLNVFATHLDSGDNAANRAEQAEELLAFTAQFAGPKVIAGDMNGDPDAPEIQALFATYDDAWQRAVDRGRATAYAQNAANRYTHTRRARIDYILTSKDSSLTANACRIPDMRDLTNTGVKVLVHNADDNGVRPSDHNLVACDLSWRGDARVTRSPDTDEDIDDRRPDDGSVPDFDSGIDLSMSGSPVACSDQGASFDRLAADVPSDPKEIVLWPAMDATLTGNWIVVPDCTAAGGARVMDPNFNAPKTHATAAPADYFEMTFEAVAGTPYHLWIRAKAAHDNWSNDSVSIQFSGAVDTQDAPIYRIGTESHAWYSLEECINCRVSGWGWQDNGFGAGVLGRDIYFEATGPQTIRIQRREDGISIDQIVLSAGTWLAAPPGSSKDDTVILERHRAPRVGAPASGAPGDVQVDDAECQRDGADVNKSGVPQNCHELLWWWEGPDGRGQVGIGGIVP
jgi:endonuclease/exonuclease/phosphatase family metal-dependent hydrolase